MNSDSTNEIGAVFGIVITLFNIHRDWNWEAQAQATHFVGFACRYIAEVVMVGGIDSNRVWIVAVSGLRFKVAGGLADIIRNATAEIDACNVILIGNIVLRDSLLTLGRRLSSSSL